MVAHPGPGMRILALTCTVTAAVRARGQRPLRHARPTGTGCGRLLAAVCAKYVPKFQAATSIPGGRKHDVSEPVATLLLLLQLLQVVHADGGNGRSISNRRVRC
jgi:hypothetical protein